MAELDGSNTLLKSYLWGTDLSGSAQGAGGVGGLLAITDHPNNKIYYSYSDANGNVTNLIDSTDGSIAATYDYSPFGQLLQASGPAAEVNPFRFSSKYQDNETKLSYYGYRYYSSDLGRWINRDPIQEAGGVNLYLFSLNSPINFVDKDGRFFWPNDVDLGPGGLFPQGGVTYDPGSYKTHDSGWKEPKEFEKWLEGLAVAIFTREVAAALKLGDALSFWTGVGTGTFAQFSGCQYRVKAETVDEYQWFGTMHYGWFGSTNGFSNGRVGKKIGTKVVSNTAYRGWRAFSRSNSTKGIWLNLENSGNKTWFAEPWKGFPWPGK